MQLPLAISLHPSRQLTVLLCLVHAGALAVLIPLALPLWGKAMLGLFVLLSLLVVGRGIERASVRRLVLRRDGMLEIFPKVDADGTLCELRAATLLGALVVLELQAAERRRHLTLLPDSADCEDLRRLRVWLAWRKSA